jgi:hypothetical protein
MPEMNMIFQCSLEIPALSISEKSAFPVSIDVAISHLVRIDALNHYGQMNAR